MKWNVPYADKYFAVMYSIVASVCAGTTGGAILVSSRVAECEEIEVVGLNSNPMES